MRLEVLVLGQQPHHRALLPVALHGHLVLEARHDDLAVAHLGRAVHRDQVAVEDADVAHAHAAHLEQVVRPRLEELRVDLVVRLDVFLGEDGPAGGDAADQRQAHLLAQRVAQLDAARGAGTQLEHALALQGAQVLLGGIGRLEAERLGDLGPRRRHAVLGERLLDEAQDLALARSEVVHGGTCIYEQ